MRQFFSLCDPTTKEVVKVLKTDFATAELNAQGLLLVTGHSTPRVDYYDEVQRKLTRKPDNELFVGREAITAFKEMLEFLPLAVNVAGEECVFDVDALSQQRMEEAYEYWETNVLVNGRIEWVLANNSSIFLDKHQLHTVVQDIKKRVAARRSKLFAHAQQLIRKLPHVSEADLKENRWPQ